MPKPVHKLRGVGGEVPVYTRTSEVAKAFEGIEAFVTYDTKKALYRVMRRTNRQTLCMAKELYLTNVYFHINKKKRLKFLDGNPHIQYFHFTGHISGPLHFKSELKVQIEPVLWETFMYYDYQQFVPLTNARAMFLFSEEMVMQLRVPEADKNES